MPCFFHSIYDEVTTCFQRKCQEITKNVLLPEIANITLPKIHIIYSQQKQWKIWYYMNIITSQLERSMFSPRLMWNFSSILCLSYIDLFISRPRPLDVKSLLWNSCAIFVLFHISSYFSKTTCRPDVTDIYQVWSTHKKLRFLMLYIIQTHRKTLFKKLFLLIWII